MNPATSVMAPGWPLLILPVAVAAAVLVFVGGRGVNAFKKQGVAWGLTALMIVAAIGIGFAKAPVNNNRVPDTVHTTPPPPGAGPQQGPGTFPSYVRDDAGVLSDGTERTLYERNLRLYGDYGVVIAVVTCNYGRDDLYDYALKKAEELDLRDRDFIVVLDIRGDNYWLVQGVDLMDDFTDDDCSDYAWNYMEDAFAEGDYDRAVRDITEMLELWYGIYFG